MIVIKKFRFYSALYLSYFNWYKSDFQEVACEESSISYAQLAHSVAIYFWVPDDTAGAKVIVHDVYPVLLNRIKLLGLPWQVTVSDKLPVLEVDFLVCFKALPFDFYGGTAKKIMLICDQAETFWSHLGGFDGLVATSSTAFANLVALKNKSTAFISESESNETLEYGKKNLLRTKASLPYLMWHGGTYSSDALMEVRPILECFASKQHAELLIVSGKKPYELYYWGKLKVHHFPWSVNAMHKAAGMAKLGIIPARKGLRTSYLKPSSRVRLLYALGVPTIGDSRVPDVKSFMNRFAGPMAGSIDEWSDKIDLLWDNTPELDRLGAEGWRTVSEHYSTEKTAQQWVNYFLNFNSNI